MPQTMRAAVAKKFGAPLTFEERPIPTPRQGEVLVKVAACGVCHTDVHAIDGDWPVKPSLPFIPGHEVTGHVAALGEGVKTLREGDAVGIAWLHDACGMCAYCLTGWETLCAKQHNTGYSVDGGYAQYALVSEAFAARLPPRSDLVEIAPILCAGVTTYKGIKETDTHPGDWIAISGIGGLGHVAVQYAKAMGLRVLALDVGADQLSLARKLGADLVVNATDEAAVADANKTTGGVHGALVTAVSPPAFAQCLSLLRSRGTMSLVGLPPGGFTLPIFEVVLKRLTVRGSIVGTRQDLNESLEFAGAGKVRANTERRRLTDINEVVGQLKAGKVSGRIVLQLD